MDFMEGMHWLIHVIVSLITRVIIVVPCMEDQEQHFGSVHPIHWRELSSTTQWQPHPKPYSLRES